MPSSKLIEKELYFKEQELIDLNDSDDAVDEELLDSTNSLMTFREVIKISPTLISRSRQHSFLKPTPRESQAEFTCPTSTARAIPDPPGTEPNFISRTSSDIELIRETPTHTHNPSTPFRLQHNMSLPTLSGTDSLREFSAVPRANGKRKRPADIKVVPEHQQYLKDMIIYFFPNDDKNAARRMRISKAIEYGALWFKDWREGITHVIVDNNITYDELTKHLKMNSLPANVDLVNEHYVPDCLMYKSLVGPNQRRYQALGLPEIFKTQDSSTFSPPSPQAPLQLNRAKGKDVHHTLQTPSRVEETSFEQSGEELAKPPPNRQMLSAFLSQSYHDALAEAIEETKSFDHLPLDLEEDENTSRPSSSASADTDSEGERPRKFRKMPNEQPGNFVQDNFQCMQKHNGQSGTDNPNARTIAVLQEMLKYYDQIQDQWRTVAYRKAIASLNKQTRKILTKEEAILLPYVGERLAAKIEEIVWTNKLRRLENARLEPSDEILQRFLKIYGVGLSQASRWVNQGFKTLDDLRKFALLTENQRVGIEHYDDFQTRIPRAEVEQHGNFIRDTIEKIEHGLEVTIMGSYRRGAADSGDIDLIITKPNTSINHIRTFVLETVVPQLMAQGFLKVSLATTHKDNGTKWHGACALPDSSVWRRIDLLLVPWDEMGAALIYFTGNDIFNRSIRLLASRKGMRLNQRGLFKDVIRGKNRERLTEGTLVEGKSEKKIFDILGVPWRPPHHRIC